MHAVVVRVNIKDRETAESQLKSEVVPRVSQAPGFKSGYWTWKDGTGLAMAVFDSENEAKAASEQVPNLITNQSAVTLQDVEVREVVAHA